MERSEKAKLKADRWEKMDVALLTGLENNLKPDRLRRRNQPENEAEEGIQLRFAF